MRFVKGVTALALVAAFAAACTGGSASPAASSAASASAPASAAASPSEAASASMDACAAASLPLKTAGTLTIGADNPAYPPYYQASDPNPDPWELGDPTNRLGFEGRVAWAIARNLGFVGDTVKWVATPFNNAIQPGPKDFDMYLTQVSYSPERAQAVDLSDGYYDVAQAVVAAKDSDLSKVTTISGLKDFQFGAQVGTTSLNTINTVVAPSKEAKVYDTNDLAVEALKNGQIDGLVVDLPTALYVTTAQFEDGVIVGQFAPTAESEHFSVVLDKDSPLTECVNEAIADLKATGELGVITTEELSTNVNAPVFQP
jgi:polar amino acid transport system substrate-binding protein